MVIGNPPYQSIVNGERVKGLWIEFHKKALSLLEPGGTLAFVTPEWFGGAGKYDLMTGFNITEVDTTAKEHFNVAVDPCFYVIKKEPYQGKTRIKFSDGEITINLRETLVVSSGNLAEQRIVEKLGFDQNLWSSTKDFYNKDLVGLPMNGVALLSSQRSKCPYVLIKDGKTEDKIRKIIPFDTAEEAEKFLSDIDSPYGRFWYRNIKTNFGHFTSFPSNMKERLTDEEKEYIESEYA